MRIFGSKLSPSTNTYIEAELAFVALQYDWPTSFDPTIVKLFLLRDFVKKYSSNGNFFTTTLELHPPEFELSAVKMNLNLLL